MKLCAVRCVGDCTAEIKEFEVRLRGPETAWERLFGVGGRLIGKLRFLGGKSEGFQGTHTELFLISWYCLINYEIASLNFYLINLYHYYWGGRMRTKSEKSMLIRKQLDQQIAPLKAASSRPLKGWVRSVREALGMSGKQLAARLGVEPPRVTELEKAEVSGGLTLRSLQRAADALECDVVYALVPRTSLDESVRRQATKTLLQRIARVSHTMRLEDQALSVKDEGFLLQDKVDELMRDMPRWLWDNDERI